MPGHSNHNITAILRLWSELLPGIEEAIAPAGDAVLCVLVKSFRTSPLAHLFLAPVLTALFSPAPQNHAHSINNASPSSSSPLTTTTPSASSSFHNPYPFRNNSPSRLFHHASPPLPHPKNRPTIYHCTLWANTRQGQLSRVAFLFSGHAGVIASSGGC